MPLTVPHELQPVLDRLERAHRGRDRLAIHSRPRRCNRRRQHVFHVVAPANGNLAGWDQQAAIEHQGVAAQARSGRHLAPAAEPLHAARVRSA
jgi:hypothetical protein